MVTATEAAVKIVVILAAAFMVLGLPAPPASRQAGTAAKPAAYLVYTGALLGQIEPCG
jgi:hypothetical protein